MLSTDQVISIALAPALALLLIWSFSKCALKGFGEMQLLGVKKGYEIPVMGERTLAIRK